MFVALLWNITAGDIFPPPTDLMYAPPEDKGEKGKVWMRSFKPFQVGDVDLEYYKSCRENFTTDEWIDLVISSMGFNPKIYEKEQKTVLLTRLLPLVESRVNLIELAPKGTKKSTWETSS